MKKRPLLMNTMFPWFALLVLVTGGQVWAQASVEKLPPEILKYADDVEVLEPPALRAGVRQRIMATQRLYAGDQDD